MKSKKPLPKGAAKRVSTKKPKTTVARKKPVLPLRTSKPSAPAKETKLTPKQQRFVDEYLIDLNATQAAIRAGYSPKTANEQGAQNLAKLSIATEVQKAMDARSQRCEITQDRVLKELARLAFFDIRKLYKPNGDLKGIHELDEDSAAVLSSVEALEEFEGTGKERKAVGYTKKVKIFDKVASINLAMRHLKMLTDKNEVTGPNGGPQQMEHSVKDSVLDRIASYS